MAINEGWTHVKSKSRRNASSTSRTPAPTHLPDTFTPRTTGVLRPPEALRADHDRIHAQWLESPAYETLVRLVDEHAKGLSISKAVCLGIGTFDPDDGAWEAKRAAYVQLCALTTLTSQLQKYNKGSLECIFQEPIFTDADKSFLTSLGHRIVTSPTAYELIDDTTLLFAVHLYRPIYAAALKSSLPAMFVGTGWDVWDTVTMEKSSDLENMKKMDKTYTRHAFPQDTASTAFSSTSIYFGPPPLEKAPPAARPASLEASHDVKDDRTEESTGKDMASTENSAAHVSADESADNPTDKSADKARDETRDETTIADDCAADTPNYAKGPGSDSTTVIDSPSDEQHSQ